MIKVKYNDKENFKIYNFHNCLCKHDILKKLAKITGIPQKDIILYKESDKLVDNYVTFPYEELKNKKLSNYKTQNQ